MKTIPIASIVRGPKLLWLVFLVFAAWSSPSVSFAAEPVDDERRQIENLIGAYYVAVAAEDVDKVVDLHHWENSFERDKVTALVEQAFAITNSEFERIRVQSIELYPERNVGLARVGVDYVVRNSDGSDAFSGHLDVAVVLVNGRRGWRIGKVGRAADLDLTSAASRFARLSEELETSVPPAPAGQVVPPPPSAALPKLAAVPATGAPNSSTGTGAAAPLATGSTTASGLTFFAVRQKATGQCVVVAETEGISPGDTIFGAFPDFGDAYQAMSSKCAEGAPVPAPVTAPSGGDHPLTADRLFEPDEIVTRGRWGRITRIADDPNLAGAREGGQAVEDGLYAGPGDDGPTEAVYLHDGSPVSLRGTATVVDCFGYCGRAGSVTFAIRGDGLELWSSGLVRHGDPGRTFEVDLGGVHELRLVTTDGGNGTAEDWAAWLDLGIGGPTTPGPESSVAEESTQSPGVSPILAVPMYDSGDATSGIFVMNLKDGSAVFVDRVKREPRTFRSTKLNHNIFTVLGRPLDRPAKPGEILAGEIRAPSGQGIGLFVVETSTGSAVFLEDVGNGPHRVTLRRINGLPAAAIASDDGNFALIMRRDGSGSTDGAYLYHATSGRCVYFAHVDDMDPDTVVESVSLLPVMEGSVAAIELQSGSEATPEALLIDGGSGSVYRVRELEHQPTRISVTRQPLDLFAFFPDAVPASTPQRFVLVPGFSGNGATDTVVVIDSASGRMAALKNVFKNNGLQLVESPQNLFDYLPVDDGRPRILAAVPKVGDSGTTGGAWVFDSGADEVLFLEPIYDLRDLRVHRVNRQPR
jgi:hypothetical protein